MVATSAPFESVTISAITSSALKFSNCKSKVIPLTAKISIKLSKIISCFGLITLIINSANPTFISSAFELKPFASFIPTNIGEVNL